MIAPPSSFAAGAVFYNVTCKVARQHHIFSFKGPPSLAALRDALASKDADFGFIDFELVHNQIVFAPESTEQWNLHLSSLASTAASDPVNIALEARLRGHSSEEQADICS